MWGLGTCRRRRQQHRRRFGTPLISTSGCSVVCVGHCTRKLCASALNANKLSSSAGSRRAKREIFSMFVSSVANAGRSRSGADSPRSGCRSANRIAVTGLAHRAAHRVGSSASNWSAVAKPSMRTQCDSGVGPHQRHRCVVHLVAAVDVERALRGHARGQRPGVVLPLRAGAEASCAYSRNRAGVSYSGSIEIDTRCTLLARRRRAAPAARRQRLARHRAHRRAGRVDEAQHHRAAHRAPGRVRWSCRRREPA